MNNQQLGILLSPQNNNFSYNTLVQCRDIIFLVGDIIWSISNVIDSMANEHE